MSYDLQFHALRINQLLLIFNIPFNLSVDCGENRAKVFITLSFLEQVSIHHLCTNQRQCSVLFSVYWFQKVTTNLFNECLHASILSINNLQQKRETKQSPQFRRKNLRHHRSLSKNMAINDDYCNLVLQNAILNTTSLDTIG